MTDDMAVYIANLGRYNEGYLVGAWFTFPIDEEDVKEKIGLNEQYLSLIHIFGTKDTVAEPATITLSTTSPVSYTHLDVYKRQDAGYRGKRNGSLH